MYHHIGMLSNLCNDIQQKLMIIPFNAEINLISAFSLAKLAHIPFLPENVVVIFVLVSCYVDTTLLTLFTMGGMVTVYRRSEELIRKLKSYRSHTSVGREALWIQKFVKSCKLIKIKFGANNFIEKLAPLKCLNCAARLAIQIYRLKGDMMHNDTLVRLKSVVVMNINYCM